MLLSVWDRPVEREFDRVVNGARVVFGKPWREVLNAKAVGKRAAIVCSPGRSDLGEKVAARLFEADPIVVATARRHVPQSIVSDAAAVVDEHGADAIVAVGGGSAIGLGKALQLETQRRFSVIPTTYAGSEMTNFYGIRHGDEKRVGRDERVRPDLVIYDPALFADLPISVSVPSLFNAMAHAVDALYVSPGQQTVDRAREAIRELAAAISGISSAPADRDLRTQAAWGAHVASAILGGDATMAIHHKLAHVVAGSFDLPHAETHTVLLPHSIAYNAAAAPDATTAIARALDADDAAGAVFDLATRVGAPTNLGDLGLTEEQVARAADRIVSSEFENPRRPERGDIVALLNAARLGQRPVSERTP